MAVFLKRHRAAAEKILLVCFIAAAAFVFLTDSPIHIWRHGECATDSSVFQTVAYMMEHGFMPYRDSFDHKGPLLYLINYFGRRIAPYRGVWVVEYGFMTCLLFALYKIARLKCGKLLSCVSVLTASALLGLFFEEGNLTEEYAMPFIAIALYIFLDYFINKNISKIRLFLCGFSFGAVFFLRPNMISVWVVFCLAVFLECLLRGNGKALTLYLLHFLAGVSGIIVPVTVWMSVKGILAECIRSYFLFNFQYCSAVNGFSGKWEAGFHFLGEPAVVLSVIICIYLAVRTDRFLYGIYLCYIGCTVCFAAMSGMQHGHYGMILVPAVVFPTASLLEECEKNRGENGSTITFLTVLWLMVNTIIPAWMPRISSLLQIYETRNENEYDQLTEDVCWIVEQETAPDEKISVYGNWDIIYLLSNRMHATRYSYQSSVVRISPEIREEYFRQLEEELPKLIVINSGGDDKYIMDFLSGNRYEQIWREDREEKPTLIYKKTECGN